MATAVLIVEDNEDDLFLLTRALQNARVSNPIHTVRSGAEMTKYLMGIGTYRDRHTYPVPGLILLDLRLPDMQGTDVVRFLEGHTDLSCTTIVIWSGSINSRDAADMRDLGIKCRVLKPESAESLDQAIRGLNDLLAVEGLPPALDFEQSYSAK
jgi:CheY-like chemotaxis protein